MFERWFQIQLVFGRWFQYNLYLEYDDQEEDKADFSACKPQKYPTSLKLHPSEVINYGLFNTNANTCELKKIISVLQQYLSKQGLWQFVTDKEGGG